jgi:vesicle transport through interaction with t-SNAREs protein 1
MDNFPTALFDSYEQDFRQIIDSIHSELDRDGNEERGGTCTVSISNSRFTTLNFTEERKAALRRVVMDLDEADELVSSPHRTNIEFAL